MQRFANDAHVNQQNKITLQPNATINLSTLHIFYQQPQLLKLRLILIITSRKEPKLKQLINDFISLLEFSCILFFLLKKDNLVCIWFLDNFESDSSLLIIFELTGLDILLDPSAPFSKDFKEYNPAWTLVLYPTCKNYI